MSFIPVYILILFLLIIVDYAAAIFIEKSEGRKRKFFLMCSICVTILMLCIFKYFNFLNANFQTLASFLHWNYSIKALSLILPIGLSFHTFQSLSYVIEVYRGKYKAETNIGIYALYVMFYPQLVAGPIERPQNLLPQFYHHHTFQSLRVANGLKRMLWGFFKKIVMADNLAAVVNVVYNNPTDYVGFTLILAVIFFAFQVYCDFSGYSDIAIGAAQVMGFKLMENFRRPYFSRSLLEFWNRWHISLYSWFRDYLYYPIIGNKITVARIYFALIFVFLISGLWHGAKWTSIIYGAFHGIFIVLGLMTRNIRKGLIEKIGLMKYPNIHKIFQVLITFSLVTISFIFFRANTLSDAVYILSHLFSNLAGSFIEFIKGTTEITGVGRFLLIPSIIFLMLVQYFQGYVKIRRFLSDKPAWLEWSIYLIGILFILLFGDFGQNAFIYFQF